MNEKIKAILKRYDILSDNIYDDNVEYTAETKNNILCINEDKHLTMTYVLACDDLNKLNIDTYFYYCIDDIIYLANKQAIDEFT